MTIIQISRSKIVYALEVEPLEFLAGGSWVWSRNHRLSIENAECTVCAVGAVMRNVCLDPKQPVSNISTAAIASMSDGRPCSSRPLKMLREKKYMAALSSFFEREFSKNYEKAERKVRAWKAKQPLSYASLWSPGETSLRNKLVLEAKEKTRQTTIQFVQENFPAVISIDINGTRPAKDVRVLKKQTLT